VPGVLVRPKKLAGLGRGEIMIVRGIEEHDLQAALEVANYTYRDNLYFKEGPKSITADRRSWRLRLGVKDPEGLGPRHWVLLVLVGWILVGPQGEAFPFGVLPRPQGFPLRHFRACTLRTGGNRPRCL
jgi:hypothetical protein